MDSLQLTEVSNERAAPSDKTELNSTWNQMFMLKVATQTMGVIYFSYNIKIPLLN